MIYHTQKELVIFDLDGTILDTLDDLTDSLNYSLVFHNFPTRSKAEVRKFVGNGIRKLIERGLPDTASAQEVELVFQTFLGYYGEHCLEKTKPYDGITEVIQKLKENGCLTAVVSNKADAVVQKLCRQYFDGLIDYAAGERDGIPKKPAPDSILHVMKIYNKTAEATLYVGDSEVDLQTAHNAGIDCLSVTWGFRDVRFLEQHGARFFAHTVDEITSEHLAYSDARTD